MDMPHSYWEDNSNLRVKYEGCSLSDENGRLKEDRFPCCDTNLNFSTATCSEDDSEFGPYKKSKVTRQDPMSHRIIEKRRRDRMNNCLADLSRLIPTEYLKKGRGRIEKTEIIEMAIKHMKFLQDQGTPNEQYRLGYQECMSETMRFMVEVEGHFSHEAVCVRLLNHLQKHCASLSRGPSGAVLQTVPTTDHHLVSHSQPHMNDTIPAQVPEFKKAKTEIEPNNNNILMNGSYVTNSVTYPIIPQSEEFDTDQFEKNSEAAAASYKYKNNIKMRFNQDLNSCNSVKRLKLENGRRNSITSIENQSSSHSSPPSSELCTRISEVEHMNRNSPTDSTLSMNNQLKVEAVTRNDGLHRFTSSKTSLHNLDVKSNFSVPIFALHAKGSYYIPLTIDYKTLLPYLHNYDILEALPAIHNIVLHPVTINVNFQSRFVNNLDKYKCEYSTSSSWN